MKIVGAAGDRREEVPVESQTVSFPQFRVAGPGTRLRALRIRAVEIRAVEIVGPAVPVPRAPAPEVRTPEVLTFGRPEGDDDDGTVPPPPGTPGRRARIAAAVGVAAVGAAAMSTALFQTVVASSTSLPMHEPAPAAPQPAGAVLAAPPASMRPVAPVGPSPAVYGPDTVADPWADPQESDR